MNDNTVLRIKVPAHLYESVKEQLTLKEAKSNKAFGDWKVVKEKKLPKDGMKKVEEDLRKGVFNNFEEWKKSFPEGTEFKQENNYMVAKDSEDKELGKWNPIQKQGMHADDFQYNTLEEMGAKKERSLDELKAVKEKLEKKIHEMENNPKVEEKEKVNEVGAGVEYAWIPGALGAAAISATVIKNILAHMKKNKLTGMKGFIQAYQEVGKDASSTIDQKMSGGL